MPKNTRVHRCVDALKKAKEESGSAIAICQASTKQSYATGKKLMKKNKQTIEERRSPHEMGLRARKALHSKTVSPRTLDGHPVIDPFKLAKAKRMGRRIAHRTKDQRAPNQFAAGLRGDAENSSRAYKQIGLVLAEALGHRVDEIARKRRTRSAFQAGPLGVAVGTINQQKSDELKAQSKLNPLQYESKSMNMYVNILLEISRSHKKTKQIKAAKLEKVEKKASRLKKKGGTVAGVHVSKEAMKHLSTRKEGSQTTEDPGVTTVRQLKLAGKKHKKGQVAVDTEHGKKIGHELVKPKSEIPEKDIEKETTVQKPQGAGHVDVTKVSTNRPKEDYETSKGFSAAGPKDPKFMNKRSLQRKVGGKLKPLTGRHLKKALKDPTLYTMAPGRSAPPVSKWKESGHVVVEPKKKMDGRESMKNSDIYSRLGHLFLETDFPKRAKTARETRRKARVGLRRDVATRMGGKKTILPTNTRRDIGMQQVAARDFRDS